MSLTGYFPLDSSSLRQIIILRSSRGSPSVRLRLLINGLQRMKSVRIDRRNIYWKREIYFLALLFIAITSTKKCIYANKLGFIKYYYWLITLIVLKSLLLMKSKTFAKGLLYHLKWKVDLKKFIDGRINFNVAELSSEDCMFGKWLRSDEITKYASNLKYNKLTTCIPKSIKLLNEFVSLKY